MSNPLKITAGLLFKRPAARGASGMEKVTDTVLFKTGGTQSRALKSRGETIGHIHVSSPSEKGSSATNTTSRHHVGYDGNPYRSSTSTMIVTIVLSNGGGNFDLEISRGIMVQHLRDKIEREVGTYADDQVLKFQGEELEDGPRLDSYGVGDGDEIELTVFEGSSDDEDDEEDESEDDDASGAVSWNSHGSSYPMTITIIDHSNYGDRFDLEVSSGIMVQHLRNKIQREVGTDVDDQILMFQGQELKDGPRLDSYGVGHGDEIELTVCDEDDDENASEDDDAGGAVGWSSHGSSYTMTITIVDRSNYRERFDLEVSSGIMVQHLRNKIEREVGTDVDDQILMFNGQELEDGPRLDSYGVGDGDYIELSVCDEDDDENASEDNDELSSSYEDNGTFDITVDDVQTGEAISLYVKGSDKVYFLKRLISRYGYAAVHPDNQILYVNGYEMDDDYGTMKNYGVGENSYIELHY